MLPARPMKYLLRKPLVQALLARLLGRYLAFALRTTRWMVDGEEHLARVAAGGPAVVAFWHEHLPFMPELILIARRLPSYRPRLIHTLVSHHRDGRFIGEVVRRFDVQIVYGSSSSGGATGLRTLLRLLAQGDIVGITPDGPRGPRRSLAPGVAQVAALSGAPIVPCAGCTSRRVVLGTWDRLSVPLPFGRGVVVCGPAIAVRKGEWRGALPGITAALNHVAERAERLCPA